MSAEKAVYKFTRIAIALVGIFVIMATLTTQFIMPGLLYGDQSVPPLIDRLPGTLLGIGLGLLLCLPNGWMTQRPVFLVRMAIYALVAVVACLLAALGLRAGLASQRSWHMIPVSALTALFGLAVPACLLWSRRFRGAAQP